VDINEARSEYLIFGIDGLAGFGGGYSPDPGNPSILDRNIGPKPRIAAAIYDASIPDYKIVSSDRRLGARMHRANDDLWHRKQANQQQQSTAQFHRINLFP
jgi:hypothetical protein